VTLYGRINTTVEHQKMAKAWSTACSTMHRALVFVAPKIWVAA
jgi:hypothetical protein